MRRPERAADDFLERMPVAAQLDLAALDARHFEQVSDHRTHPPGFLGDAGLFAALGGKADEADGYADRMYVGDMAAQLWRFDFANGSNCP